MVQSKFQHLLSWHSLRQVFSSILASIIPGFVSWLALIWIIFEVLLWVNFVVPAHNLLNWCVPLEMFSVEMPNSRVAAGGSKDFRCLTFPYKLWQLLNDCNDGAIRLFRKIWRNPTLLIIRICQWFLRWSVDGIYILVNQSKFINSPSVQTVFKKVQWKSFVRQLNMYGFHKVSPVQQPCHKNHDSDFCTCHFAVGSVFYQHEHLRRWDFESLTRVTRQRKPNNLTKKENPNVSLHVFSHLFLLNLADTSSR